MQIDKDDDRYEPSITQSSFRPEQGMIQIPIERREEAIPEGYVKVVRCKDCYWWTKQGIQGFCEIMRMYPTGKWYCANGVTEKDYLTRIGKQKENDNG